MVSLSRLIRNLESSLTTTSTSLLSSPNSRAIWRILRLLLPWVSFFIILAWGWRLESVFRSVPAYGDNLEALWGIKWWYESLVGQHQSPAFTSVVFHPGGWQASTQAYGPLIYLASIPFTHLAGEAFSHNVIVLLLFALTFAGVYRLARILEGTRFIATLAALLSTFWGFRWLRLAGHWQILWGAALLPWMVWALEKYVSSGGKSRLWLVVTGLLWAVAISGSLYFIFIGGFVLFGWLLGQVLGRRKKIRQALLNLLLVIIVAGLFSLPAFYWFWLGIQNDATTLYDINVLNAYGASLNSLPVPFLGSPWLGSFSTLVYSGPADESGVANLGVAASLVVIISAVAAWRVKVWRPLLVIILIGLLFTVGPTLKWNGETVSLPLLRPVNRLIWGIGHQLKPDVFSSEQLPQIYETAIPMPGMLAAAFIPFWEGARTVSRYVFVTGTGFFVLAALAVGRLRRSWIQVIVAAILLVEILPPPVRGAPYPPLSHPVFNWLSTQSLEDQGIIDLKAQGNNKLLLPISAETLFATQYHGQPTAAGVGSVWPAHGLYLREWLSQKQDPFGDAEFVTLLREYQVRYLLLHMIGDDEQQLLEQARTNSDLKLLACHSNTAGRTPWPYPICVLEVQSPSPAGINIFLADGWSKAEDWGVWAEGEKSRLGWVATTGGDRQLELEAFPFCLDDVRQTLSIFVKDRQLTHIGWEGCENRHLEITIPGEIVEIGWNQIDFHYGFAARPVDVTSGENSDPRPLSLGFSKLEVYPRS